MDTVKKVSNESQAMVDAVQAKPDDWALRKLAALKLYEEEAFLQAADMVWKAPEMPSVDVDVAFAVKIVARARPNRAIRLVYEVLRRNAGKAEQNIALARAFNMIEMPMLASRFYGAAIAADSVNFDIGFEQQSLWCDDSGSLMKAWEASSSELKKPLSKELKEFASGVIKFSDLGEDEPNGSGVVGGSMPGSLNQPVLSSVTKAVAVEAPRGASAAPVVIPPAGKIATAPMSMKPPVPSTHSVAERKVPKASVPTTQIGVAEPAQNGSSIETSAVAPVPLLKVAPAAGAPEPKATPKMMLPPLSKPSNAGG